jgi:hypothetical protein
MLARVSGGSAFRRVFTHAPMPFAISSAFLLPPTS